jgi:hypothetical protein
MSDYGVNTSKLVFVGLLSVILTGAIIVGLQAVYYWYQVNAETAAALERSPEKLEALLAEQRPRLTDYDVVDGEKDVVAIPLTRAMELVVTELSQPGESDDAPPGTPPKEKGDE